MIRKLLTKLACHTNIFSHLLTNIQTTVIYGFFAALFTLLTVTVSMRPVHAELVDLSDAKPVITFASRDARWQKMPHLHFDKHAFRCLDAKTGEPIKVRRGQMLQIVLKLIVDDKGKIVQVAIKNASGNRCLDRQVVQKIKSGRLYPFTVKGKAVMGIVFLPISVKAP